MNSGSDIFSFPKVEEATSTKSLTERLYPSRADQIPDDPYKPKREALVLGELQKWASKTPPCLAGDILGKRMASFQAARTETIQAYLESARENSAFKEDALFFLSGYPSAQTHNEESLILSDSLRKPSGGIYISWSGKGIVINPGRHFLENFHAQGLTVRDIHFVVVTNDLPESSADVQSLYDLNYQINKSTTDIHIIHYYFSQKAFQELSKKLKPHFKQERDALHHLELFVDSPDVETVELTPGISLNYFLGSNLGIKLNLSKEGYDSRTLSVGYISNAPWSPLLSPLLGRCDLLITGFGETSPDDYNKITYNSDSLGYHGTANLLQDTAPRVLLCGEFSGDNGDIRLEAVQKLRQETANSGSTAIIPADNGLVLDLRTFEVQCSISEEWAAASQVRAVRNGDFDELIYVAPSCMC